MFSPSRLFFDKFFFLFRIFTTTQKKTFQSNNKNNSYTISGITVSIIKSAVVKTHTHTHTHPHTHTNINNNNNNNNNKAILTSLPKE